MNNGTTTTITDHNSSFFFFYPFFLLCHRRLLLRLPVCLSSPTITNPKNEMRKHISIHTRRERYHSSYINYSGVSTRASNDCHASTVISTEISKLSCLEKRTALWDAGRDCGQMSAEKVPVQVVLRELRPFITFVSRRLVRRESRRRRRRRSERKIRIVLCSNQIAEERLHKFWLREKKNERDNINTSIRLLQSFFLSRRCHFLFKPVQSLHRVIITTSALNESRSTE